MTQDRRKIRIYWFSGTGNTLWAAKIFSREISKLGHEVEMISLPCPVPDSIPEDITIGFFFPVYGQTIPVFIDDWLRKLPASLSGNPVFTMTTLAGMSGLIKGPMYSMLKRKGYRPIAIKELIMPCNYIRPDSNPEKIRKILDKAEPEIARFAKNLFRWENTWPWRPGILNFIKFWSVKIDKRLFPWIGKKFFADKSKCTKCGLCIKLCPVGNISTDEDKLPKWSDNCQQCLRCINYCPSAAIDNKRMRFLFHPAYRCPGIKPSEFV